MLRVEPGIIQAEEKHKFQDIISNFSAKPRRLPQHMAVAHGIAPPPFIVSTGNDEKTVGVLTEGTDSFIAAVHYKATET